MREGRCAALLVALVACAPSSPGPALAPAPSAPPEASSAPSEVAPETPDAEFRQKPPPPGSAGVFQAPIPVDVRLPNGLRVLFLESHAVPVVSVQLVVDRGAAQGSPGAALLTAPMLLRGTRSRTMFQQSDAFEALGAQYGASVDDDMLGLQATVISSHAERAIELLGDALRFPSFPEAELERVLARRLTAIAEEESAPRSLLHRAVVEAAYPEGHPYRWPAELNAAALRRLKRADLVRFHQENVQPSSVSVVVAGDISREALQGAIERVFGGWRGRAVPLRRAPAAANGKSKRPRGLLLDTPGATQTSLSLCDIGAPRTSQDHDALLVLNTILSRRLNGNLRQKHAYTYGASSQFTFRHGPGVFSAGGEIVREKTAEAIREVLAELEALRQEPVGLSELADARLIVAALSGRFETAAASVAAMLPLATYHLENDEFMTLRVRMQMITPEVLQRAALEYLRPDRVRLVLVGDAAVIEPGVRALRLGDLEVRKPPARRRPSEAEPE